MSELIVNLKDLFVSLFLYFKKYKDFTFNFSLLSETIFKREKTSHWSRFNIKVLLVQQTH